MAITLENLKLFQSQRMTDESDGGGMMTATEIVSGNSNLIFDDLSDVDYAIGDASIRKCYMAVTSDSDDKYLDAGLVVFREPANSNVSVLACSTGDYYDERSDIKDYLEGYVVRGPRFSAHLYETQVAGSRAITLFGRVADDPPTINSTLVLVEFTTNTHTSESYSQFIRVVRVLLNEVQEFTVSNVTFQRRIMTLELSDSLDETYHGSEMTRDDNVQCRAVLYSTIVADAARYYGIRPVVTAANLGAYAVYVDRIYDQLVPSSRTETPVVDLNALSQRTIPATAASSSVSFTTSDTFSPSFSLYLGRPVAPSSLSITVSGGTLTDADGNVLSGLTPVGTIDYAAGVVVFGLDSPTYSGAKTVSFIPAAPLIRIGNTFAIPISEETRYRAYVATLKPIPAPGTLTVSYLSGGNWYDLRDSGTGTLAGSAESYGAGTLNFSTGSVTLTLGAYPDTNSAILFAYGTTQTAQAITGTAPLVLVLPLTATAARLQGATTTLSWGAITLTDDGTGTLVGEGGTARLFWNRVELKPDTLPPAGTIFTLNYQQLNTTSSAKTQTHTNKTADGNGVISLSLDVSDGPITPGVEIELTLQATVAY